MIVGVLWGPIGVELATFAVDRGSCFVNRMLWEVTRIDSTFHGFPDQQQEHTDF